MADFILPDVDTNINGWGPAKINLPEKFKDLPYQPFRKADMIGKVSDWTGATYGESRRTRMYQSTMGSNLLGNNVFAHNNDQDESTFRLVDNVRVSKPMFRRHYQKFQPGQRWNQGNNQYGRQNNRRADPRRRFNRFNNRGYYQRQIHINREASVAIDPAWKVIETFDFSSMQKLRTSNVSEGKDMLTCGSLKGYNKKFDQCSLRTKAKLRTGGNFDFSYRSITEDPVVQEITTKHKDLNVFTTDEILTTIMCCTRSVMPWDIVAYKIDGVLIFDLADDRQNSSVDMVSVSETSNEPLQDDNMDDVNKIGALMKEATRINNTLAQQVLTPQAPIHKGDKDYPFTAGDGLQKPLSRMYRYRRFELGDKNDDGKIKLCVRTKIDAVVQQNNKNQFVTINALNEWDSKYCNGVSWRATLDKQSSTVLATEMKNNSFKVARWITASTLAAADQMKLGFVTRENSKAADSHLIVGFISQKPSDFAQIARLDIENGWGILRCIVDTIMESSGEGKYHIVKNPNAKEISIYYTEKQDSEDEEKEAGEEEEDGSDESTSSGEDDDEESSSGDDEDSDDESSSSDEDDAEEKPADPQPPTTTIQQQQQQQETKST